MDQLQIVVNVIIIIPMYQGARSKIVDLSTKKTKSYLGYAQLNQIKDIASKLNENSKVKLDKKKILTR